MSNQTSELFLVFNGEIFSYLELRDERQRGLKVQQALRRAFVRLPA